MRESPLVYVASSWKTDGKLLDSLHTAIQREGCRTWDFRLNGFWWQDVAEEYKTGAHEFLGAPEAIRAFEFDKEGLDRAAGLVAVLPAGISVALETGYAAGRGIPVVVWGEPREERFDIMWKLATVILPSSVPVDGVARTIAAGAAAQAALWGESL